MIKIACRNGSMLLVAFVLLCAAAPDVLRAATIDDHSSDNNRTGNTSTRLGTITGSVHDSQGRPLAGALISLLRDAGEQLVRQTQSDRHGAFSVRTAPGRYILRVVANGFTTAAFTNVEIGASDDLIYRFDLIPAGQGRTAPEQLRTSNDPRYTLRSAHRRRSIFQAGEDADLELALERIELQEGEAVATNEESERHSTNSGRVHGLVETYYAASSSAFAPVPHAGVNFALVTPVRENLDLVIAGQSGTAGAPQRLETNARARIGQRHHFNLGFAAARLPLRRSASVATSVTGIEGNTLTEFTSEDARVNSLAQISARVADEWTVRNGIVVVLGFDYARFIGAGDGASFVPRVGVQFDANARTRLRAAYAAGGEETRTETIAGIEEGGVVFEESSSRPIAFDGESALLERSRRLEFGIERILDERSSIEATVFFDTTDGRGVGLLGLPMVAFTSETDVAGSVIEQQGAARGLRVVYARRLMSTVKASAGYSFGRGQRLAPAVDPASANAAQPDEIFDNGFFQTAAAQLDADVRPGTRVRAVLRFSSRATVFAIDPFAGRLAVYDPSLSFLVTQELPTFGLPIRAEAVIDARNLLDAGASADDGDTLFIVGNERRSVRGGIAVRF